MLLKSSNGAETNFALLLAKMSMLSLDLGILGPFQQKCTEYNIAENIYFYNSKMEER